MPEEQKRFMIRRGRASVSLLVFAVFVGAGLYAVFFLNNLYNRKELEIQALNQVVERLSAETRIAQVIVKEQSVNPETGILETTIKFVENARNGSPLPPQYFKVQGDVIYFDAFVMKFTTEYVEIGEALRGKSICLFRRIFGEHQAPEQGFLVDGSGSSKDIPDLYRVGDEPSQFEIDLWKRFWEYAGNPETARGIGVRVAQGEAVYTRFQKGSIYTITIEHDGGINIMTEPVPEILLDEAD